MTAQLTPLVDQTISPDRDRTAETLFHLYMTRMSISSDGSPRRRFSISP